MEEGYPEGEGEDYPHEGEGEDQYQEQTEDRLDGVNALNL